jgi:hypothetical protein
MTRQCLYCAKEIPRSSASNFCSKECWTEYKKLKAMNVGADKQATVLLKKSEISDSGDTTPTQPSIQPAAAALQPEQLKELETLKEKIESLESMLKEKYQELADTVSAMDTAEIPENATPVDTSAFDTKIDDLISRVNKLEIDFEKLEHLAKAAGKFEDRLAALEQSQKEEADKPVSKDPPPPQKKGFFAKLFG